MRLKSHFGFNKQERSGIFFLLLITTVLQGGCYHVKANPSLRESNFALDTEEQSKMDSLKNHQLEVSVKTYPFNPNYITDYKGYTLGLSTSQLDRLFAFREGSKFVNSAKEFQTVTQVSDSLLDQSSPYFKFPEWVTTIVWAGTLISQDAISGSRSPRLSPPRGLKFHRRVLRDCRSV